MRAKFVSEALSENMQTPLSNTDKNNSISQKYPLENPNYLGDSVGDPEETWDMPIPCKVCNKDVHPGEFENGVCKDCAKQGFWVDDFGILHRKNS
jgi:hypothetical protein